MKFLSALPAVALLGLALPWGASPARACDPPGTVVSSFRGFTGYAPGYPAGAFAVDPCTGLPVAVTADNVVELRRRGFVFREPAAFAFSDGTVLERRRGLFPVFGPRFELHTPGGVNLEIGRFGRLRANEADTARNEPITAEPDRKKKPRPKRD